MKVTLREGGVASPFIGDLEHIYYFRPTAWMLIFLVPLAAMIIDVVCKFFSNMFCPTQAQIHMEFQSEEWYTNKLAYSNTSSGRYYADTCDSV